MTRTSGMPVSADVRERLRAAQRAESEAITFVQKAVAAETDARARLDAIILKRHAELAKTACAVQAAQAGVVRTSGLDRAAALLDVSPKMLRSAVKESAQDTSGQTSRVHGRSLEDASRQATSSKTPATTTAPTIAPSET